MNPFAPRPYGRKKAIRKIMIVCVCALLIGALALFDFLCPFQSMLPAADIPARAEGELRVHFLSVGQGDCAAVEFPDGEVLFIDAGDGGFEAETALLRFVKGLKPVSISLAATHANIDHYGGFIKLTSLYPVKKAYLPAVESPTAEYRAFVSAVARTGCETETLTRYSVIAHPSGAYLVCISPYSAGETDENDSSAVLYLSYFGVNVLFCADISGVRERRLLREYALMEGIFDAGGYRVRLNETDIVKVAHHGSAYSSDSDWLGLLGAKTAVISCGRGNSYGHPASGAVKRLSDAGAEIFRTDELGNVTVHVLNGNYEVTTERE